MTASKSNPPSAQGCRFPKALAAAGLAAVLVGCGGGSSDTAMDEEKSLTLPTDGLPTALLPSSETLSILAGESRISGGVMFSCAAGGAPCQVTIGSDGKATYTGGDVKASLTVAAQHTIDQNTANANRDADRSSADAAISVATNAVIGVGNESTDAELASAQEAIDAATSNIESAAALTQSDKTILLAQVAQQQRLLNSKKDARMAYMEEEKKDKMEDENRVARTQERQDADTAILTAFMKVDEINNDSTEADLESAQEAINAAKTIIEEATHLPEDERTRRLALVSDYQESFDDKKKMAMDAMKKKEDDMKMATTKAAMNLYDALDAPINSVNALDNTDYTNGDVNFDTNEPHKLVLRIAANAAGDDDIAADSPLLTPTGDAEGMGAPDGWGGMRYEFTDEDKKIKYEAVVYDNRDEPTKQPFLTWAADTANLTVASTNPLTALGLTQHIAITGSNPAHLDYIEADIFKHSGKKTHTLDNNIVEGSFNGVSGMFRCDSSCTSDGDNSAKPKALGGTWTFYPSKDATVDVADSDYLLYGWWVRKDMDDVPTVASAFHSESGGTHTYGWTSGSAADSITGSATYAGKSVGKFTIHDPFNAELNNSGHFTADVELIANFGSHNDDKGVNGTIDNFRLNGGSDNPKWSVSLDLSTRWVANGGVEGPSTTWSIDGRKAAPAGQWEATMFDNNDNDDLTLPTTATGEFYSEIDSRYRMVGAFAAEIDE